MRTPSTYNPGALAAAYSPNKTAWPIALWVMTLTAVKQQAHGQPLTGRTSYLGAAYRPQPAPPLAVSAATPDEVPFEETQLAAMPVRSYRVKAKIRSIEKGQLHL